jgi:hypothetical protein
MHKKMISFLVILSLMSFMFTSAFKPTPPIQISLTSVQFLKEKGVTFKFQMAGNIKRADLKGSVLVGGKTLRLYCNSKAGIKTNSVVVCTSPAGTAKYAGSVGVVFLAGRSFIFITPARLPNL